MATKKTLDKQCAICCLNYLEGNKVFFLPCSHHFHVECVLPWFTKSHKCPNCRYDLNEGDENQDGIMESEAYGNPNLFDWIIFSTIKNEAILLKYLKKDSNQPELAFQASRAGDHYISFTLALSDLSAWSWRHLFPPRADHQWHVSFQKRIRQSCPFYGFFERQGQNHVWCHDS